MAKRGLKRGSKCTSRHKSGPKKGRCAKFKRPGGKGGSRKKRK